MSSSSSPIRCLITAGPTREHLDPVRFLSNGSSGKMGYALATAAAARGWHVNLISGPVALPAPDGVSLQHVVSAAEMFNASASLFATSDLFLAVAAVADYRPAVVSLAKGKKSAAATTLDLVPTIDILATLAARKRPDQTVVGFAAETQDLENSARRKLADKRLDWIVANDVSQPGIGMNADANAILLLSAAGARFEFGPALKPHVAAFILDRVAPGANSATS